MAAPKSDTICLHCGNGVRDWISWSILRRPSSGICSQHVQLEEITRILKHSANIPVPADHLAQDSRRRVGTADGDGGGLRQGPMCGAPQFGRSAAAEFCYPRGTMSALNGDKARFNRERRAKLARRERSQAIRRKLKDRTRPRATGTQL